MRYSPEHKAETHARIVRKASVRLREKGAHGVGVADLMKEAGLTHGGFYAHFESREALVVESFGYAIDRAVARWRKLLDGLPPQKRLAAIVDGYLSPEHRDDVGHGCAIPALGAEIARESAKTRKAFAAKLDELIDLFAGYIVDVPAKTARRRSAAMLATLTGTLVMARVTGGGELSDEILSSGREVALAIATGSGSAAKAPARAPAKKPVKKTAAAKR
ncbi:TetR/AcrR family transcriptional regulator [Bradyrhizobium sp. HKCCYLS2038]|uniref:TetR/AcrR family transcriptional regulator n=1 Tax=unclassified Bradyrhizobium TaxID=2631580 RepID=UPI003EBC4EA4